MFRGCFIHTIDSKGRTSLPAQYRVALQRRGKQPPFLTNGNEHLLLYPYEDWCAYEQQILSVPRVDPNVQAYVRFMVSGASPCAIDKQGRILIPPPLRARAKLEREVVFAGVGECIEVWDKDRFDAEQARIAARLPEIAMQVASQISPRETKPSE
ncbi:MAG: division/cell wall cluster transcriptional repressor MraZ [Myxococcota bacterium]